ncbi:MAG: toll/interleukin-1 receptor domain-containing protein [Bacteroidia bacterium]
MSLFTEGRLRNRVQSQLQKSAIGSIYDSPQVKAKMLLEKSLSEQRIFSTTTKTYDIFLSHSSDDAELVEGLKLEFQDAGYSVYVDWIEDPQYNRSNVTKETALMLQERMKNSKSLIYAFSHNATASKWMPWELGYFDGIKGLVTVLPIFKEITLSFTGNEYLGLYNYIDISPIDGKNVLWVHETSNSYIRYEYWLNGQKPYKR